jgi:valyl-tRNA synthetase
MDTWATSSLTPQIAGGWERDTDLWSRVFPFNVRPQAHEIIRTWLFATVVRAHLEENTLPWSDASISGWILDPDRKKMSKSKGNVVTPMGLLDEHGSDAVRYWAASGRPGTDTAFDVGQMKIGRRLAIKVLNASKFALSLGGVKNAAPLDVTEPLDRAMLGNLASVVEQATTAFESFNYTKALEVTEASFWQFCDDYVELVKDRVYGAQGDVAALSAKAALGVATEVYLKLFAPFLPFVTDEVWTWWQDGSVHTSKWPHSADVSRFAGDVDLKVSDAVAVVLSAIRKVKSDAQVSMKTDIVKANITAPADVVAAAREAEKDLLTAGRVQTASWTEGNEVKVEAELAAN